MQNIFIPPPAPCVACYSYNNPATYSDDNTPVKWDWAAVGWFGVGFGAFALVVFIIWLVCKWLDRKK